MVHYRASGLGSILDLSHLLVYTGLPVHMQVASNISCDLCYSVAEYWFGPIWSRSCHHRFIHDGTSQHWGPDFTQVPWLQALACGFLLYARNWPPTTCCTVSKLIQIGLCMLPALTTSCMTCIMMSNVPRATPVDYCTVDSRLVVGFSGQPHYHRCNRPYHLTATFQTNSSYSQHYAAFRRSKPILCIPAQIGPYQINCWLSAAN